MRDVWDYLINPRLVETSQHFGIFTPIKIPKIELEETGKALKIDFLQQPLIVQKTFEN